MSTIAEYNRPVGHLKADHRSTGHSGTNFTKREWKGSVSSTLDQALIRKCATRQKPATESLDAYSVL
jgi:hypothetical protein